MSRILSRCAVATLVALGCGSASCGTHAPPRYVTADGESLLPNREIVIRSAAERGARYEVKIAIIGNDDFDILVNCDGINVIMGETMLLSGLSPGGRGVIVSVVGASIELRDEHKCSNNLGINIYYTMPREGADHYVLRSARVGYRSGKFAGIMYDN